MSSTSHDSLFDQARAALRQGNVVGAQALCDELLEKRRPSFQALMLRADIAGAAGDLATETRFATRAVQADGKNNRARAHLATRLNGMGEYRKAMAHAEKALRAEPGLILAAVALAVSHEGLDQREKARRTLAPIVARSDAPPEAIAVFVRLLVHDGEIDAAIEMAEALRAASPPPESALRNALLMLSKAYEKKGEHDLAFERAIEGNGIAAALFDADQFRRSIDDIIDVFGDLSAMPRASESSDVPVFVVGMPRVGSTLVDRIIHAHAKAHGAGEIGTVHTVLGDLPSRIGTIMPYPQCARELTQEHLDALSRDYLRMLRRLSPKAMRITNKELFNFLQLGLIALAWPGARVIHCTRDPLDTCVSCFLERLPTRSAPYASSLEDLGHYYREYQRLMAHWRDVIDIPMMEVAYEDLVADQEATSRGIIEFLGLDWDDACLQFHEVRRVETTLSYQQVRQPMYGQSVGRWKKFEKHLGPLRAALEG